MPVFILDEMNRLRIGGPQVPVFARNQGKMGLHLLALVLALIGGQEKTPEL
jgi:hypothetical protein